MSRTEDAPAAGLPAQYPAPATSRTAWEQAHAEMLEPTESHGAPLKVPPDSRRANAPNLDDEARGPLDAPPPSGKYVVLHTGVGPLWRQGEVVEAKALASHEGLDVQRLVDLGAVRPADEREAAQHRVTLPGTPGAPPLELQVLDRDRQLAAKEQELVRLRDELRLAKQAPRPGAAPLPQGADPGLIAEKDRVIEGLRRELVELRQERPPGVKGPAEGPPPNTPGQAQPPAGPPDPARSEDEVRGPDDAKGLFGRKKR